MSPKDDYVELEGVVEESLPNATFRVNLDGGQEIFAHLSGKMRMNFIKILPGDRVLVEMSVYDLTKGRITRRLPISRGGVPVVDKTPESLSKPVAGEEVSDDEPSEADKEEIK